MAESACLRRSFSNPSEPSHDFSDGDPLRALGESISFGRYMSETLAWEKWSAFSHNRYREEAEKYSKPGSVAKMKAYFEAHYKKVGVKKPIALEQANNGSSFVQLEAEDTHNLDHLVSSLSSTSSSPALNLKPAFPNNEIRRSLSSPALHPGIDVPNSNSNDDELTRKYSPNLEAHSSVNIICDDSSAQAKESENEAAINTESSLVQVYQGDDAVLNGSITEISAEIKVVQPKDAIESGKIQISRKREATIEKEATDKLNLKSNKKSADAPLRSSKKSNVSKLSSSLARLSTPVRPKKEGDGNLRNPKFTRTALEKKKPMPKLVQKSADVADVKLMKKSSPASHKSGIGKAFTPLGKIVSQSFARTPAPSATRASVNSVSRHTFATPQSETKRSRVALEKSFAKNRTDQKLQSPAVGNMKSPAQSLITFSPFSFRTEERAKKRKEFFERRLEKEAEKLQLQEKNKLKSKAEFRKSSQCANFSNTALNSRREILREKTKIPIAPPQPPKYDNSKPSTNLARGKCSQPHRSSSVSSKPVSGNKSAPVTLPTKKRHENDSPNIL